jgi:hypothetical protein
MIHNILIYTNFIYSKVLNGNYLDLSAVWQIDVYA